MAFHRDSVALMVHPKAPCSQGDKDYIPYYTRALKSRGAAEQDKPAGGLWHLADATLASPHRAGMSRWQAQFAVPGE